MRITDVKTNPTVEKTFLAILFDLGEASAKDVYGAMLDLAPETTDFKEVLDAVRCFAKTHQLKSTVELSEEGFVRLYYGFGKDEMAGIFRDIVHAEMVDKAFPLTSNVSTTLDL